MRSARHHSLETGLILVGIGLLFLLKNLGIADIGDLLSTWWPLLLVGLGVWTILETRHRTRPSTAPQRVRLERTDVALTSNEIVETRVFGDAHFRLDSPSFRKGSIHATFGDIDVDLGGLRPAGRDARLAVNTVLGDIRLRIPASLPVHVVARSNLGGVQVGSQHRSGLNSLLTHHSSDFDQASQRLTVVANTLFGDVLVEFAEVAS